MTYELLKTTTFNKNLQRLIIDYKYTDEYLSTIKNNRDVSLAKISGDKLANDLIKINEEDNERLINIIYYLCNHSFIGQRIINNIYMDRKLNFNFIIGLKINSSEISLNVMYKRINYYIENFIIHDFRDYLEGFVGYVIYCNLSYKHRVNNFISCFFS